ncbi:hypothetical protein IRJ41_022536, partial [Triplophysa rosa]
MLGKCEKLTLVMDSSGDLTDSDITKLQTGDLCLRKVVGREKVYHAGVYCGRNEVIEYTGSTPTNPSAMQSSSSVAFSNQSSVNGRVSKISVKIFISGQKLWVYRLKAGIPKNLLDKIMKAMDYNEPYNVQCNNCFHFAMRLLEISPGPEAIG